MELYDELYRNFLFNFITDLVPYVNHLGVKPLVMERGKVALEMPVAKAVRNHVSSAHAGALYTLLETVAGGVVVATFDIMRISVLVKSASIEYAYPGLGTLTAKASMEEERIRTVLDEIRREGKSKPVVRAEAHDGEGRLVAAASFVYSLKEMRKE